MKLVIKITLYFVIISSIVFLIGAVFSYNAMSREIDIEERLFLKERLQHVLGYLEQKKPNEEIILDKMVITPLDSSTAETELVFTDTLVTHATLRRIEPHLKLDVIRKVNGKAYQIMLYDLIIEEDDIEDAVRESMVKTYLMLLLVSLVLSLIASYYVFRPFQFTLAAIRDFSIKQSQRPELPASSTAEFKKLNQFIDEMMKKAQRDYRSLKEFSENASHEIQTPISIAQGKLELLMESPELREDQMELISSAQNALQRLSKMSNSLSLLTKIENKEFSDFSPVNVSELLSGLLFDFKELIELKQITLTTEVESGVEVSGSATLLGILMTNLLNNAVRHNRTGGSIRVVLTSGGLDVINTGEPLQGEPQDYFMRFKKGSENPDSSGLGLSIVQQICSEHHFSIIYEATAEQHHLSVRWESRN
ncbi:MAG: HAMP domain-containing sensor histidine kinase [Marinoscillum sp.]|uniref:sensor histidine kinase n=1 Tax=Marinoscillum sp. TaxID=2024838 RepID=UPI0032FCEF31